MDRRLLYVASTYSHIVNFHRPYLEYYRRQGWECHVACGGQPMDIPEADRLIFVPFAKSMTAPDNGRALSQLRRLIRENKYDLIHVHTALAAFFTRAALWGMKDRPRVVNTVHGYLFSEDTPFFKRQLLLTAERLTARQTDLLLTMNQADYAIARRYELAPEIQNIPGMGVDFGRLENQLSRGRAELRFSLGLSDGDVMLVYGAEFSGRKNQAMLIRAMARTGNHVKLFLPGSGGLLEECRTLARALGLEDRVYFPGQAPSMAEWYLAADIAVSSSRSEGLPFNLMEAMHFSLPIAATRVKGHTDLVEDGVNGFLIPVGDEEGLARQIDTLAEQPELRARLGAEGANKAAQYALERVMPQVLAAWGEEFAEIGRGALV